MKYDKNERASVLKNDVDIDFILNENEQILWEGKPNKKAYLINKALTMFPFALIWLLFDSVFIYAAFNFEMPLQARIFICVFMCFHLIPVWIWLTNVLTANKRHKNTKYALTTHRILIRTGLVGVDVQSISYKDVQNVNLKISIVDRLLKVGDLYFNLNFKNNKSSQNVFFDIENPYEVYKIAQKIVMDIQTDIEFPNAYRPENNPGYKTKVDI